MRTHGKPPMHKPKKTKKSSMRTRTSVAAAVANAERERDQWRDDYQREAARAADAERELSRKRDAASFYYKEIIRLRAKLKKIREVLDS